MCNCMYYNTIMHVLICLNFDLKTFEGVIQQSFVPIFEFISITNKVYNGKQYKQYYSRTESGRFSRWTIKPPEGAT